MTYNMVTVTGQWSDGTNPGEGNYQFIASGTLMDSAYVAIVTPVIQQPLDSTGSLSAVLLASDNFGAGILTWNVKIVVQGMEEVVWQNFAVNYSSGATQPILEIITTAGWVPGTLG